MGRATRFETCGNDVTCMKEFDALLYPCMECDVLDCPEKEIYETETKNMHIKDGKFKRVKTIGDCLVLGVDFSSHDEGIIMVTRSNADGLSFNIVNEINGDKAWKIYSMLIGAEDKD